MKLFRKILVILLILILLACGLMFILGYSTYSQALNEKPLLTRIDEVTSDENYVSYDNLSKDYINAVVAVEDHRFYDHGAIDPIGIARALWVNIKNGELQEGGSTITQQVAKNVVFSQDETLSRKLGEILAAFDLEKNYSKNEILAIYVNTCYFGDGYYGIYDASMGYYNKEPKDLNLDEASMLAGVPNAPSVYAPTVNPDLAKKRQAHVLEKMLEYGYISNYDLQNI
jgi:monofunctional glycosyltransferase